MQTRWMVACGALVALTLAGCPNRNAEHTQGGGGGNSGYKETHDRSNPVTREQATNKAVPLQEVPGSGKAYDNQANLPPDNSVSNTKTQVASASHKVDVNTATVDQLMQVPGMSYTFARGIVQYRPFKNKQDMANKMPNVSVDYVNSYDQYFTYGEQNSPAK